MNWIFDKAIILYAFAAAAVIGIIWLIGECRLWRKLHPKSHHIPKRSKGHVLKLNREDVNSLNGDIGNNL